MGQMNLTNRFLESVQVKSRTDFWDALVNGLVCRVTPTGVKTWNLVYTRRDDGKKRRFTMGRFPVVTLAAARERAMKEMARIFDGADPADRRPSDMTVEQLGELFIERYAKLNKRTWQEDQRILRADVYPMLGQMDIKKVKRRHILDVLDAKVDAGSAAMSTKLLAVVRKAFNWAEEECYLEISPAGRIKPRVKSTARDRFLTNVEIEQVWTRLDGAAMSDEVRAILTLLLLTGQRNGEVSGMRKGEIDLLRQEWHLPRERTKNGLPHIVPLSQAAMIVLRPYLDAAEHCPADQPLFARTGDAIKHLAVSNSVRRNQDYFGLEKWVPHDLRRTAATGMVELGVQPHVVEAVLNHISGHRAGVAGIYNRSSYRDEKRVALDLWAAHLERVWAGKQANVVSFGSVSAKLAS